MKHLARVGLVLLVPTAVVFAVAVFLALPGASLLVLAALRRATQQARDAQAIPSSKRSQMDQSARAEQRSRLRPSPEPPALPGRAAVLQAAARPLWRH